MERYFGTYQTFQTIDKRAAADLIGADNLVGDLYQIECTIEEGVQKAWLVNKFGKRAGYFDPQFSRQMSILKAQNMTLVGLLSFVAYTDHPDPGHYWGKAAVIAYDPKYADDFQPFVQGVAKLMRKGARPVLNLQEKAVDQVIQSHGEWLPKDRVPLPAPEKGTALVKTRQSPTDRLVEESRKGNKGCYLLSWLFLLALVALVIFGLKSCGIF